MIVNRGFTFSNIVGAYAIRHSDSWDIEEDLDAEIIALYPGSMKKLYSQNSFEEGSIAYQFAAIDLDDEDAILAFCSKYGLLYSSRLEQNLTNDYMFSEEYKSLFSENSPNYEPDKLPLTTFRREAIIMNRFLGLKSAMDAMDIVKMVQYLVNLLLAYTDKTHVPSNTETEHFNHYFYAFIKHRYRFEDNFEDCVDYCENGFNIQAALDDFLAALECFAQLPSETERMLRFGKVCRFDDMFHCTWQRYHEILKALATVTVIKADPEGRAISFEPELDEEILAQVGVSWDMVSLAANACIADIMNAQTGLITPELHYEDGKLISDWHITSLLEAMYMELQVTFSPNTMIRRCANPTCNFYFDVGSGNTKKIYCSQRCALLMAKRKQRQREKQRKREG